MDLRLFSASRPDDCFLDQGRRILADFHSCSRRAHEHDATCLPELEGRLGIAVHEDLLDGGRAWRMVGDERLEMARERREAGCERLTAVGLDLPVGDMDEPIALRLDETPASGAKAGIEAENSQARRSSSSSGTS